MIPPLLARNLTIPIVDGLRSRRKVLKELREAEELQWLSQKEILDLQWTHLQKLIREAYQWVPYYKKKFDEYGVNLDQVQTSEDLKRIPILTKKDINDHREEMVNPKYKSRIYKNTTGGSTGVPTQFYQVDEHWVKNTAATIKNYKWTGVNEGEKVSIIWGNQLEIKSLGSWIEHLKFMLVNKQWIPVLSLNHELLQKSVSAMSKFKPKLIQGYNTYLYLLAQYILENHFDEIRPRAVISGSNTLFDSQRKAIESAFHCRVFDRYGSRELGCIASECSEHTGLHINMENVFVEFERLPSSDTNDKLFNLICTSMGNYGMPFIRYEIGDLGIPMHEPCPCGRGLPMIEKLKGRTHDILKTPSGKIITGDLFDIIFLNYSYLVQQFQVRQKRLDQMEVDVAVKPGVDQKDLQAVRSLMESIIGPDVEIILNIKEEIPVARSGKLHLTISEI